MKKIALFLVIFSCAFSNCTAQTKIHSTFRVKISDDFLSEAIRNYIRENNIDTKKKIISIKLAGGLKKTFEITNYFSTLYRKDRFTPSYYSVQDDSVVVIFFTMFERIFARDDNHIINEIDRVIAEHKIKLVENSNLNYSAPVWRVVEECDGTYEINKRVSPFEYDSVPCGYSIVRDSVKLDSLILKRHK